MEVYSPERDERKQLHEDYTKDFSELRRVFGIRHLTSKKEDRQNNPEIELNEAQFRQEAEIEQVKEIQAQEPDKVRELEAQ
ncbi:2827_t:CDS:2 [Entrophospora sp. SA101]|nr:2827_t:CDS:2 [Entrophospora sp. SA101]